MNISEEQIEQFFQWIREMPKEEFEERFNKYHKQSQNLLEKKEEEEEYQRKLKETLDSLKNNL